MNVDPVKTGSATPPPATPADTTAVVSQPGAVGKGSATEATTQLKAASPEPAMVRAKADGEALAAQADAALSELMDARIIWADMSRRHPSPNEVEQAQLDDAWNRVRTAERSTKTAVQANLAAQRTLKVLASAAYQNARVDVDRIGKTEEILKRFGTESEELKALDHLYTVAEVTTELNLRKSNISLAVALNQEGVTNFTRSGRVMLASMIRPEDVDEARKVVEKRLYAVIEIYNELVREHAMGHLHENIHTTRPVKQVIDDYRDALSVLRANYEALKTNAIASNNEQSIKKAEQALAEIGDLLLHAVEYK